jgi:hypothetical protein
MYAGNAHRKLGPNAIVRRLLAPALALALLVPACSGEEPPARVPLALAKLPPPVLLPENPKHSDPAPMRKAIRTPVDLPDAYPDDAPIYPGAIASSSGRRNGRVTAFFSTEDLPEQVAEYQRAKLATLGWEEVAVDKMPKGQIIHAAKGDRTISVLISQLDAGTEYQLTVTAIAVDP